MSGRSLRQQGLPGLDVQIYCDLACALQQSVVTYGPELELELADRARIIDRTITFPVNAAACVSNAAVALQTLILAVSLLLLPGAEWMHAT